jgi:hypothetical protein
MLTEAEGLFEINSDMFRGRHVPEILHDIGGQEYGTDEEQQVGNCEPNQNPANYRDVQGTMENGVVRTGSHRLRHAPCRTPCLNIIKYKVGAGEARGV